MRCRERQELGTKTVNLMKNCVNFRNTKSSSIDLEIQRYSSGKVDVMSCNVIFLPFTVVAEEIADTSGRKNPGSAFGFPKKSRSPQARSSSDFGSTRVKLVFQKVRK